MKSLLRSLVVWLVLVVAGATTEPAIAQAPSAPNAFGATIRNPGSVMPEWWNEARYIPEKIGESLHLRQGSSGNFGGRPTGGRANCDLPMLYSAVSGIALTQSELEKCALLEYDIFRGVSGDRRNLNDVFVRRDTLAEFSERVKQRVALFRQTKSYYLRAAAMAIDPFQIGKGLSMRANWLGGYITPEGSAPVYYFIEGDGFQGANANWWSVVINGFDEAQAREVETARSDGRFVTALNFFRFEAVAAREVVSGVGVQRYLRVKVNEFNVPYATAGGAMSLVGIRN